MSLESKEILVDNIKIYSEGLVRALKDEKFTEAKGYIVDLRKNLESTNDYLDSQLTIIEEEDSARLITDPHEAARSHAERASLAAERAHQKADRLEVAAKKTESEAKRLKKAASRAEKDADKAEDAAKKATSDEKRAAKHSIKAAEHASDANREARSA